ncbi:2-oxoglutarate-dependent dioxygenase [Paraburkholderia dipogonis]|uniref:2-oxoglutarate-dependent dioxygenase n=1 Tax=Paraburkholderia dipogonis TaxID=1211383 RepID=A0A4Y8MVE6_9BURK|nr:2OG-Fe(II) oxygenase [Paraburkholderia dipogonis]TFE41342.1 2-oxoglutarate-dependent dioxygenase [Paraburkholderia dipogonis]
MPVVDAAWEEWLSSNVARGCSPDSMVDAMVQAGFATDAARAAVHKTFGQDPAKAANPAFAAAAATEAALAKAAPQIYQYDDPPVARGNLIRAHDRDVRVLMRCERPQVIVFGDVLSPDECAEMIERSRHRLKRSTTVNPETGKEDVIRNRTSEGIWYQRGEDAFIERMDRRISSLMNWPVENGEGLQILHYGTTGEYRPHFDYFPPDQPGSAVHTAQGGQRVATLVIYLNDVPDGGETIFPEAGMSVAARQGGAVYFRYMNGQRQLDPLTLHGGAPVLGGDKWIMTKWMRERAYG